MCWHDLPTRHQRLDPTMSRPLVGFNLFSQLPDELLENIVKCATEFDSEFEIIHPDRNIQGYRHVACRVAAQAPRQDDENEIAHTQQQNFDEDYSGISDPLFANFLKPYVRFERCETAWLQSLSIRYTLCLVSRRFSRISTPVLYSSFITADNAQRLELLYRSVESSARLGRHIRRLSLGYLGMKLTNVASLLVMRCPNLIILDAELFIEMYCIPNGIRSLRIRQEFNGIHRLTVEKKSNFLQLKQLELLELRQWRGGSRYRPEEDIPKDVCTADTLGPNANSSKEGPFYPSLRTIIIHMDIPIQLYNGIIHPGAPIRNAIIVAESPPPSLLLHTIARIPRVTHLFIRIPFRSDPPPPTQMWAREISRMLWIPSELPILENLRHVDIEALWLAALSSGDYARLFRKAVSFSIGLHYIGAREALQWIKNVLQNGLAPRLRIVYTSSSYLRSYAEGKDRIRDMWEMLRLLEDAGIEWVSIDIFSRTIQPMKEALAETIPGLDE